MSMTAQVLASTDTMPREVWLQKRRKGIGGSDVAKLTGHSRYGTPMSVWLDKTGQSVPEEAGEAAHWGTVLEEVVAREFSLLTGKKVRRRNAILQHPEYPWMLANVDRLIIGENSGLECKTASAYLMNDWTDDEVPTTYYLQCQHYMAVTGYEKWYIAVLIGGNQFIHKCIERDDKVIEAITHLESEFWNEHVLTGMPPAWDGSTAASELIGKLHPMSNGQSIELAPDAASWVAQFDEADQHLKVWEERKNEAANHLKDLLGEFESGWSGERKITWKSITSHRLDTKALKAAHPDIYNQFAKPSESRRFTVK